MLSVGDHNNGTAHRYVNASRRSVPCTVRKKWNLCCVLQNLVEKRLRHLGVIYADVFEWVEFQSGEPHFVLQYHASDMNVSAEDLLCSVLSFWIIYYDTADTNWEKKKAFEG